MTNGAAPALVVQNLELWLPVAGSEVQILTDVSLSVERGSALGLVGESGSGKSMTARSILRLLPPNARVDGRIVVDGTNVLQMRGPALKQLRSQEVAMIFQDPRAHINPVRSIGDFLTEGLRFNRNLARAAAERRAVELLDEVGIPEPRRRLRQHPHELSGGMLQRVMIAAALAGEPSLLLADEPTTALDVTTQADIVALLDQLRREHGLAMLFITHDLELGAAICERIAVMYAGTLVEEQAAASLVNRPLHPYTTGLLQSRPDITRKQSRLPTLPGGAVSAALDPATGCPFAPRCGWADGRSREERPALRAVAGGHAACHHVEHILTAAQARRES